MIFPNFYQHVLFRGHRKKLNLKVGKEGDIVDLGENYPEMFKHKRKKSKGKNNAITQVQLIHTISLGD